MLQNLSSAQTGLSTSQSAIENISNNLANENTPGYIKRTVSLSEMDNSKTTYANGVQISSVDRAANEYMALKIQGETSKQAYYSKSSSVYESLETIFIETDTSGLSKSQSNFFFAIENLRGNPNSEVYKNELISSSNEYIYSMQSVYSDVENLQTSLKDEMYTQVNQVNKLTSQIAELNNDIANNPNSLELLDKRDLLVSELSTYGDIEVSDEENYYQIKMAGQSVVFNNTSNELNVVEDYTAQVDVYDTSSLNDSSITDGQTISITLNNGKTVNVTANTAGASDTDVKQQLVDAINLDPTMNESIKASLDNDGNLVVESKQKGEEAFFDLEIQIVDTKTNITKNENLSQIASDDIHIESYDKRLNFNYGSLKTLDENTTTTNPNNVLYQTQKSLNDLAYSIIDTMNSYVDEDGAYTYGEDTTSTYTGSSRINDLNLFSGTSVMSMSFNSNSLTDLSQEDLDYLGSLQFKDDFNINSNDPNAKQSYSDFLIELRVDVASTKESMDLKLETQESIVVSLQSSYDQISKVDSDEEMINLLKFQSAYEANAKVITTMDEMIQTILNM